MGFFGQVFSNYDSQLASQIQADPAAFAAKYKLDPSKLNQPNKLLPQSQAAIQQYYATQNPASASPAGASAGASTGAVAGSHPAAGAVCPTCGQPMPGAASAASAAPMAAPGAAPTAPGDPSAQSTDGLWKNTGSSYQ